MYPYQEPRREEWDRITITKVEPVIDTSIITPEIAEQMTCDALCENDMSCGGWDLDPYEQINCVRYDLRPGLTGRERCLARPENRDLCRENGDYDWDCTSAPASASCAEDYVVRLDPECTYGMDEAVEACKYTCVPGTSICDWSEEQQLCEPLRECGTQCKMWCQLCPSMLGECLCDDVTACEAECAESQCTDAAKLECENCNWRCDSDSYPGSPVQIQLAADAAAREAAEAGAADGGAGGAAGGNAGGAAGGAAGGNAGGAAGGNAGGAVGGADAGPTDAELLAYETCVASCADAAYCGGDALDAGGRCDAFFLRSPGVVAVELGLAGLHEAQCEDSVELDTGKSCVYSTPGVAGGSCMESSDLLIHPPKGIWNDDSPPLFVADVSDVKTQRCANCKEWCTKCPLQFGQSSCDNVEACKLRCDNTVCMLDLAVCEACHAAASLPVVGQVAVEAVEATATAAATPAIEAITAVPILGIHEMAPRCTFALIGRGAHCPLVVICIRDHPDTPNHAIDY
jgi:hypothetical protein|eukprot:COSAG06_NODE_588_length_13995_cov_37.217401_7_plen_516_part_00